jgi:hypothetical protein
LAGNREHLPHLHLVHAKRALQAEARKIPIHQPELNSRIGERAHRLDAGLGGENKLPSCLEPRAA